MSWNFAHFLGETSGDNFSKDLSREIFSIFWRTFLKNIMSWIIIEEFSGDISRVDFGEYLCRQIWRMFWGRFLAIFCHKILSWNFKTILGFLWWSFLHWMAMSVARQRAHYFKFSDWAKSLEWFQISLNNIVFQQATF